MDTRFPSTPSTGCTERVTTVLLTSHVSHAERLQAVLAERYRSESEELVVRLEAGDAAEVLKQTRTEFGGVPVGVVVVDEVSALEALSNGADEVLLWPPRNDEAIHGFFDRTLLRASIRRGGERTSQAIAHADKLTALGTLVAGVAHEINNPLTALQLSVDAFSALMTPLVNVAHELSVCSSRGGGASPSQIRKLALASRNGARERDAKDLLNEMVAAASAIADVVQDLTIFARSDSNREEAQLVNVNDLVDQALRLVGREIEVTGHIERDFFAELPALVVPPGRLIQVLVNILVNAAHALREVERSVHRVRISTRADDEHVAISVSDTGLGIPSEVLAHIFDPFFTTKRVGAGTGLGLSISRSILRDLGGDLIVESVHGTGATFVALVPIPEQEAVHQAYMRTKLGPRKRVSVERRSILLVDDDVRILKAYARVLGRSCNVLMASDGQEAIDLLRSGSNADALVAELQLPEVDGRGLYEWLTRENPALARRTVFIAAEASRVRYREFLMSLENPVLSKPVSAERLLSTLNDIAPAPPMG